MAESLDSFVEQESLAFAMDVQPENRNLTSCVAYGVLAGVAVAIVGGAVGYVIVREMNSQATLTGALFLTVLTLISGTAGGIMNYHNYKTQTKGVSS